MLRRWPLLVPPAFFLLLVALQPADRVVVPPVDVPGYPLTGSATRLITDDCDTLAYALRAENSARGRQAGLVGPDGRPVEPGFVLDQVEFNARLAAPGAFAPRYFLEYPPAALALFRLGLVGSGRSDSLAIPPALLDAHQVDVAWHTPATPDERALYRAFRHAIRVYWFVMLAALVGLMALIDRGVGANGTARGPAWLLLLPGFLYFTPCRFDVLPAALVVGAVAAADRRRVWLSGGCLGLAVALKMYPLAVAPLLLRYAARSCGQATGWCVAAAVPVVLSYGGMVLTDGVDGAVLPLKFQLDRDPEPGWCFYDQFLPLGWAAKTSGYAVLRAAPVLLAVALMTVRRPPDVESLLRRCAIAVVLFVTMQTFFSPQWWQWLAVLLVPLAGRHRWLVWYVIAHDLLTYLHFPVLFDSIGTRELEAYADVLREVHVWTRAGLWAGLVVTFAWYEAGGGATPRAA
jgi:hypothetical protein